MVFAFWFAAAYASYQTSLQHWVYPLILIGMSSPTFSALLMFALAKDKEQWKDFFARLRLGIVRPQFMILSLVFMPCMIILATAISLLFGGSLAQFSPSPLADQSLSGMGLVAIAVTTVICCSVEELGWRGYGVPSLLARFTFFRASSLFGVLWFLWHIPAFFIQDGYFQEEILNLGPAYVATYFLTLFAVTFFINWVYVRNQCSILLPIIIHASMNLSIAFFHIEPMTRIVFMVLMALTAIVVVMSSPKCSGVTILDR